MENPFVLAEMKTPFWVWVEIVELLPAHDSDPARYMITDFHAFAPGPCAV